MKFSTSNQKYITRDELFSSFVFVESKQGKSWQIFKRNVFLDEFVIVGIVKHAIGDTVVVDKFWDLFLFEY